MKKLLGSLIALYFSLSLLHASQKYNIDMKYTPQTIYANQTIHMNITCRFKDRGDGMDFIFSPPKIEHVNFILLKDYQQFKDGRRIVIQDYLVEFTKPSEYSIALDAFVRKTNSRQLREASTGRDLGPNSVKIQYTEEKTALAPLNVHVLPSAPFTGDFSLQASVDKTTLEAYEPVQLKVELFGSASKESIKPFTLQIEDATIFSDEPKIESSMDEKGFSSKLTQHFAISSTKNFTIPPFTIEFFDTKTKKIVTLQTKKIDITVAPPLKEKLLDTSNYPTPSQPIEWQKYLDYLFWYILGILSTIAFGFLKRKRPKRDDILDVIKSTKEPKELLKLLLTIERQPISECISDLEKSLYAKKDVNMSELKKRILSRLR